MKIEAAVIGAGPAGCATAIRLSKLGVPAAIFTKSSGAPANRWLSDEEQAECLPHLGDPVGTRCPETIPAKIFGTTIWPVSGASLRPHYAMASAWGSPNLTVRHSICNPAGHGWFVDRTLLDRELLEATESAGVPVSTGRLVSVSKKSSSWILEFANRPPVEADVVVDASGRSAVFARHIGLGRTTLDRQVAVTAKATPENFPPGEALVESAENGWWFSALTPQGGLSVTWFTYPGHAPIKEGLTRTTYTASRTGQLLPEPAVPRAARTDWLESVAGEGWLAVGDAAFASDPLGSQGLLRALESAERAAKIISEDSAWQKEIIQQYSESYVEDIDRFLDSRIFFYNMERRWIGSSYWKSAQVDFRATPRPKPELI